jgi:hypothetical protein
MTSATRAVVVDGVLKEIGDRLFYDKARMVCARRTITGSISAPKLASKFTLPPAVRTRNALSRTVRRVPEVMVKITGTGKGAKSLRAHLDYISRNGKVALEDQYGDRIEGAPAIRDTVTEWAWGGIPIAAVTAQRSSFNIVLSMPPGTDRAAVTNSAREFAKAEFADNHSYVFATHEDEKHPHVHLCVKAMGRDGVRLNPRKADLQRWRELFAEKLRDNGIEANATRRPVRGVTLRAQRQQFIHLKQRGITPKNQQGQGQAVVAAIKHGQHLENPLADRIKKSRQHIKTGYELASMILEKSSDPSDLALAREIRQFASSMAPAETAREKIQREFSEKHRPQQKHIDGPDLQSKSKEQER